MALHIQSMKYIMIPVKVQFDVYYDTCIKVLFDVYFETFKESHDPDHPYSRSYKERGIKAICAQKAFEIG